MANRNPTRGGAARTLPGSRVDEILSQPREHSRSAGGSVPTPAEALSRAKRIVEDQHAELVQVSAVVQLLVHSLHEMPMPQAADGQALDLLGAALTALKGLRSVANELENVAIVDRV